MAVFKLVTVKSVMFQGVREEFTNQYHLSTAFGETFGDAAALNAIKDLERNIFAPAVTFERGVSYETGPGPNNTRHIEDWAQAGAASPSDAPVYRECAVLVEWELPRAGLFNLGAKRFLRKWLHTACLPGGGVGTAPAVEGGAVIPAPVQLAIVDMYADPLRNGTFGGGQLVAPNGDRPTGPSNVKDYLEHRQFHR